MGFLTPGGKRRFLASRLQAPTSSDSASIEDVDAEMLDDDPQDDLTDKEAICFGAVSLEFTLYKCL